MAGPVVALVVNTSSVAGARRAFTTALGSNGASLILIALGTLALVGFISFSNAALSFLSLAACVRRCRVRMPRNRTAHARVGRTLLRQRKKGVDPHFRGI